MGGYGAVSGGTWVQIILLSLVTGWVGLGVGRWIFGTIPRRKKAGFNRDTEGKKKEFTVNDFLAMFRINWRKVNISDDFRESLMFDLSRLGVNQTPEDIRKAQVVFTACTLLGALLVYMISPIFGVALVGLSVWAWIFPVRDIRTRIKEMNEIVEREFPRFYNQTFHAYKRDTRTPFKRIVAAYMEICSPTFRRELKVLIDNIESAGEIEALRAWKRYLPVPSIVRFTEIMENRLNGEDNIAVMESFKTHLDRQREIILARTLQKDEKVIDNILHLTYVPFVTIAAVYFGSQMASSGFVEMFKGFSR